MTIDVQQAQEEFSQLKSENQRRNYEYFLLRQAVKGNFRWPNDWPSYLPKVKRNLCKPIAERHATFLLGKGFTYNVERPNTLEFRNHAERTEKILARLLKLSNANRQFDVGALVGSQLGRTIFKVYKKGSGKSRHAAFSLCQPDYFYGIPAGDDSLGEFAKVYYSYPMDKTEAKRVFGEGDYKTEGELARNQYYDPRPEDERGDGNMVRRRRTVPVLEVWTKDDYLLVVGGVVVANEANPFKWKSTGEGFIPFIAIENIRSMAGDIAGTSSGVGEADIGQARELNEQLNYLISQKSYIVQRYLRPTLVWEGAPQNYAETLTSTLGGGGAIPTRLGSRIYFLTHDQPNPAVMELESELRQGILETSGMNDAAVTGEGGGSVNTGPSTANQLFPVTAGVERKRTEWTTGLEKLMAMLLEIQEGIGDSEALGEAVVNQTIQSADRTDGEVVTLSGKDINGLREVSIAWPGMLPKDDLEAARLEMEKASRGLQSIYTTLEKLGEQYPDDELFRVRMENQDPALRGEKVAEQLRAETPLAKQAMSQDFELQKQALEATAGQPEQPPGIEGSLPPAPGGGEALPADEADIAERLRQVQQARLNEDEDELTLEQPPAPVAF